MQNLIQKYEVYICAYLKVWTKSDD